MSPTLTHDDATARGYLVALASAAILSTTAVFIRYLTETYHIPPLLLAFWRSFFVTLTLLLALRLRDARLLRLPPKQLPYLVGYGLLFAVFNGLWTLSVALNGAAVATVLVYSSAAFTALLARWLLKEPLSGAKVVAILLALAGCILVAEALNPEAWATNLVGILTGTLAGLGYAVYSLMGRSAAQRGLNPWTTLLYVFGFATIFFLLANLLPGQRIVGTMAAPAELFWFGSAWAGWGMTILLAAGPTVTGFGLYNTSLSLLPSSVANLILTTEPVFTAVLAYLFLGEQLTGRQIVGSGLILGGVLVLRWRNGRGKIQKT
ncbi:MAG: DMT family transporter [Ardenticatenaceae bacterium]|nr:DMT family transporter [Anaerolineales bacterium]MCB8942016.1 DMT family transporter [Ardenticatenaceae bacterium]MCB8973224.1 DMT family transporter [Ardenticatenaceae bacterium]